MSENNETSRPSSSSVTVEIFDQSYRLRGQDSEYIHQLAAVVDSKMRLVASQGKTVDSLRVAVLAALNIADELFTTRERYAALEGGRDQASTLRSLSGLLDSVLEERKAG